MQLMIQGLSALIIMMTVSVVTAQTPAVPKSHPKHIHVGNNGMIYVPYNKGFYLRISLSEKENEPSFLLRSQQAIDTKKDSLPFHFEGPGEHTIQHPREHYWAVENPHKPKVTDSFPIMADGTAPEVFSNKPNLQRVINGNRHIYGEEINIGLTAKDDLSGEDGIFYSVNHSEYKRFVSDITLTKDDNYDLRFYAVDNVGNVSGVRSEKYAIDLTPPESNYQLKSGYIGDVLSASGAIELRSKDMRAGVANIFYRFNDAKEMIYKRTLTIDDLKDGQHNLTYYGVDRLNNVEKPLSYSFYLDRTPPEVTLTLLEDKYRDKVVYVSGRTKIQLEATDNKIGVKSIMIAFNSTNHNTFSQPVPFPRGRQDHTVTYYAADRLNNTSQRQKMSVVLDVQPPKVVFILDGIRYFIHNTFYITSATQVKFKTSDDLSGVQSTNFALGQDASKAYTEAFTIAKEGAYSLNYSATDNVNNRSDPTTVSLFVDNTPPEIFSHFGVSKLREDTSDPASEGVYPLKSKLYLASTDKNSGVNKIVYSINKDGETPLRGALDFIKEGVYNVYVRSVDNVGNEANKTIKFTIRAK